jgi:glycosyltransferase involved in cell wall biosynthesis
LQGIGTGIIDFCLEEGIPVHVSVHDSWFLCDRQFMVNYKNVYCGQGKIDLNICSFCTVNPNFLSTRFTHSIQLLEQVDSVIAPSNSFASFFRANLAAESNVVVIPHGVDKASRLTIGNRVGKVAFGYLGGIGPVKGSTLLFKVLERCLDLDFELIFVNSTGNLGIDTKLPDCSEELRTRIRVVPHFTQDKKSDFYENIDCFLLPSQTIETFSLSVREALNFDKWVISTSCGGPQDVIQDGINGNLIPMGAEFEDLWLSKIMEFISERKYPKNLANIDSIEKQVDRIESIFLERLHKVF